VSDEGGHYPHRYKQGDLLAPFLFLLVAEGLSGLVRSAEARGLYRGFRMGNSGLSITHLQYADDTLFLGEASMENLWSLKTILRCFELTSGLKVNFTKSSVMGVNVGDEFLGLAERFLYCRVGSVPFTYLGLPVGANPCLQKTWQPLLHLLANRLGSWGNRYVSLGGRVVFRNSVLSAIPIFFMSVMKMPVSVWKKIVRLQKEFLWGGIKRSRSIPWVSWAIVFRPKREEGLGVRDLHQVNLSLLAKWRWRYFIGEGGLWRNILIMVDKGSFILPLILVVGHRTFVVYHPGGLISPSWVVIGRHPEIGFLTTWQRLLRMVSLPIFGMIRGVGLLSLELCLGSFFSYLFRWMGKWGI